MSSEPVFVAIGVACVVAVLLFIVFIIYCVKRQQDKERERQTRQRRVREERHRRHLMRTNVVRPPPYDPNGQNVFPISRNNIPVSPPPAYKEVATPLPRNRNGAGGDNGLSVPPFYGYSTESDNIQTISRNVAPVNTLLTGNNHYTSPVSVSNRINNSSTIGGTFTHRSTPVSTTNNHDDTSQAQSASSDSSKSTDSESRSSNSRSGSNGLSSARNSARTASNRRQELDAAVLLRAQNSDRMLSNNTVSHNNHREIHNNRRESQNNHRERIFHESTNSNDSTRRLADLTNRYAERRPSYNGATQINYLGGFYSDRSYNPRRYDLSASYGGSSISRTFGNEYNSNIFQVSPANTSSNRYRTGGSTLHMPRVNGNWMLDSEDLSLI